MRTAKEFRSSNGGSVTTKILSAIGLTCGAITQHQLRWNNGRAWVGYWKLGAM